MLNIRQNLITTVQLSLKLCQATLSSENWPNEVINKYQLILPTILLFVIHICGSRSYKY